MTYGVHIIYLKFGSFNGIDPIVPNFYYDLFYYIIYFKYDFEFFIFFKKMNKTKQSNLAQKKVKRIINSDGVSNG
jgi:hypothetical protein